MTPIRMCGGCMTRSAKHELIRIVRMPDSRLCIDIKQKLDGRGVYICKKEKCLENAIKRKWLSRGLRCEVEPELFEELRKIVSPGSECLE